MSAAFNAALSREIGQAGQALALDNQTDRPAGIRAGLLSFEIERNLAAERDGLQGQPREFHAPVRPDDDPLHDVMRQRVEDGIGGQNRVRPLGRDQPERVPFPEAEEARDLVDLRPGEDNRDDWRSAKPVRRQRRCGGDLLRQVRRRIDEDPPLAVAC